MLSLLIQYMVPDMSLFPMNLADIAWHFYVNSWLRVWEKAFLLQLLWFLSLVFDICQILML